MLSGSSASPLNTASCADWIAPSAAGVLWEAGLLAVGSSVFESLAAPSLAGETTRLGEPLPLMLLEIFANRMSRSRPSTTPS